MFKEPLYIRRSASEKVNITFEFIRENFKPFFRNIMIAASPLCIMFAVLTLANEIEDNVADTSLSWLGFIHMENDTYDNFFLLFLYLGFMVVLPMSLTLVQTHYDRNERLTNLKFKDIRMTYFLNLVKWFLVSLPMMLILVLAYYGFSNSGTFGTFFAIVVSLIIFVIFEMAPPTFILGKETYSESMNRSISYGIGRFWNTLPLTIYLVLLAMLVFLWEIGLIAFITDFKIQLIGSDPGNNLFAYIVYWIILLFLLFALTASIALGLSALGVGIAFQYGSLEDRTHLISLKEKVKTFESLKDE